MHTHLVPLDGYRMENEGDWNKGVLIWLRQIHLPQKFATEILPGRESRPEYRSSLEAVVRCQYKILHELDRLGITDIFAEAVYDDFHGDANRPQLPREPWLGEDLSGFEAFFLSRFGAPLVYAALNNKATLHKTISREEHERIYKIAEKMCITNWSVPYDLIHRRYQELTLREMDAFFLRNSGAIAVLVFGGAHDFSRGWTEPAPLVYSKRFYDI